MPVTPAVVVSVTPTSVSCFGGKDGTATALAFNGNRPYTYLWSTTPAQTDSTATGLHAGTYTVTVTTVNGCVGTGTVTVQEPALLKATITPHNTCPGFTQGSIAAAVSGGNGGYSYQWSTTPVQTSAAATGLSAGTYTLTVTDSKGCADTVFATIGLFTPPQVDAGADAELCYGSSVALNAIGAETYVWSPAGVLSCTSCASPDASPAKDTTFTVIGTDANGCKDTDDVRITVIQHVPVSVAPKQVICAGDSVRLGVAGGIGRQWLPPVAADSSRTAHPAVQPAGTTDYQVIITENRCFKDTLTQQVEVVPLPTVNLGPDIEVPNGTVVTINAEATNAVSIAWLPAEGLSCPDCYTPRHTVRGRMIYVARVENSLGCPATDTINIRDVCDEHYFYFANLFSPNGDGANDRFYPQGIGTFPVQHFMIYDRWGEIVFSAANIAVNDISAGWDGTYKGQALKPDVYVYVMDAVCESGAKVMIRGDVTLVR